jgi:urate oxidase
MKIFAEDESASVQATMYKMCDTILAAVPEIEAVDYALPNKHYFEIGKRMKCTSLTRSPTNMIYRSLMA